MSNHWYKPNLGNKPATTIVPPCQDHTRSIPRASPSAHQSSMDERLAPKWPNRLARLGLVRRGPARGRSAHGNRPRQSARRRPLLHQTAQDLVGGQGGRARAGTIPSRRPSVYLFVRTRVATLRAPTASQQYVSELLGRCARSLCSPTLPCSGTNFLFFFGLKVGRE